MPRWHIIEHDKQLDVRTSTYSSRSLEQVERMLDFLARYPNPRYSYERQAMKNYTLTITIYEARTSTREIVIEAENLADARKRLLALPDGQVEQFEENLVFTLQAYNTENYKWNFGDMEIVEVEVDDPENVLCDPDY